MYKYQKRKGKGEERAKRDKNKGGKKHIILY